MAKETWIKFALFAAVAIGVAVVDLATKECASDNLASPEHPQFIKVTADEAGMPAEELLEARFPGARVADLLPLAPALETAVAEKDYPIKRISQDRGYYIFPEEERRTPPIFLLNPAEREFYDKRDEGLTREDWKESWRNREVTWEKVITDVYPDLDEEDVTRLLDKQLIHPIARQLVSVPARLEVREGDAFLLVHREVDFIPGFFRFIYAENPGAAWGILRDAPLYVRIIFLQVVSVLAMGLIVFVVWKTPQGHLLSVAALAGIMGGAAGNFVDRFARYRVVDFMDMYIKDSHWPTYNVADIGISVGVALLFIQIARKKSPF